MTSERERLKPCPFCGSPAALESQFGREWWVQCLGCDASHGVLDESPGDAENRWNTRAALPAHADQPTSQEPQGSSGSLSESGAEAGTADRLTALREALTNLLNAFHEGRAGHLDAGSEGYVRSVVEAGERALENSV